MWKKKLKLTAFIKESIDGHCRAAGHEILEVYNDAEHPGMGLEDAIDSLHRVQGIITCDFGRFVSHQDDRYRFHS